MTSSVPTSGPWLRQGLVDMIRTDKKASLATKRIWYSLLKAFPCLPSSVRTSTSAVCPDVGLCLSPAVPDSPEGDRTCQERISNHDDTRSYPVKMDGQGAQGIPPQVNMCPTATSLQHPVCVSTSAAPVIPSSTTPASSPVQMQDMSSRALMDPAVYSQLTCPQCSHTFTYRLPMKEKVPLATVGPPVVPRALGASGSQSGRQTSFTSFTPNSSREPNGLPHSASLLRRLPMRSSSNALLSFGVRRALSSTAEAPSADDATTPGFGDFVPHVLQADVLEHLQTSRAAIRQSAFSSSLAGMRMHDFYVVGRRINSGLSAEVFEATEKATGGKVALKVYFNSDRAAVHETITEHVCMTRAASDLVLRCHGIVFDGCRPALVLDLAQQSLRNYLQEAKQTVSVVGSNEDQDDRGLSPFTSFSTAQDDPYADYDSGTSPESGSGRSGSERSERTDCQHAARMSARQSDFLKHSPVIPLAHVMKFTASLIEAAAIIHGSGLAHCDIKPENIMIMEDGSIRVCDFGASAAIDPRTGRVAAMPIEINELQQQLGSMDGSQAGMPNNSSQHKSSADSFLQPYTLRKVTQGSVTDTGRHKTAWVQGTESYNAPERSNKSDMRKADVWAIGCVLYELCTGGQPLFRWQTEREKYMQLAQLYDPTWMPPRVPAYAAGWQEAIDAMLAVNPEKRLLPEDVLRLPIFEYGLPDPQALLHHTVR